MQPHRPLKELRDALGLTQEDVATVAGVTKGRVSQVESGAGTFSLDAWLLIWDRWRLPWARLGYAFEDVVRGQAKNGDGVSAA